MFPQSFNAIRRHTSPQGAGACMPVGFVLNPMRLARVMMI